MTVYFIQAFIYLCAAIVTVPLSKKLGLGSVLGYLIAGVIIGPVTGLVGQETVAIQHFAEFGVVMMLFLVGLELDPKSLWEMRNKLLGLGGLQVGLTALAAMAIALLFNLQWSYALAIGLIFSLSSTAIVLQTFNEKGLVKTEGGKNAFSVLLFQDIAVIPILAFIPLLAMPELMELLGSASADAGHGDEPSLVAQLAPWAHALVVIGSIVGIIVGGHFLSRPLFRYIADSGLREIFTAAALMLVVGIAALMSLVGLSPALGTFLAGVVLANSEFRHELESDIEPFKGLLLGLFFITVGAGINLSILAENAGTVIMITAGLMLLKALVLFALTFIFNIKLSDRWLFALSLSQAGEFGFVLLSYTYQNAVLPKDIIEMLSLVVALSMFLTPILFIVFDKIILPKYAQSTNDQQPDDITEQGSVIIAGIGRFGQIVNRLLIANGVKTIVLDHQVEQVLNMKKIDIKSFFGDATRPDLLHTAGIADASALVIAIDNRSSAIELVEYARHHYPNLKILVRAFDRGHNYELRNAGADIIISETYFSALELGKETLTALGTHPFKSQQLKHSFCELEQAKSDKLYQSWLEEEEQQSFSQHYRDLFMELEKLISDSMHGERTDKYNNTEREWTPPPKDYLKDFE